MKFSIFFTVAALSAFSSLLPMEAGAASLFDESQLDGPKGPHLVIRNQVNVRERPASDGKRLTKLNKGEVINVIGKAKGTQWLAARKDGDDLGFIYAPSLTPMIDASSEEAITGKIDLTAVRKPECSFKATYEGRTMEEETTFISVDYHVNFKCSKQFDIFKFDAWLFMSEVPHDLGNEPVYQITLNLPEIATDYEEFLSATALYDHSSGNVVMDAVSLKEFKDQDLRKNKDAKSPKEAIKAALELHLSSFNLKAWNTISGKTPPPGQKEKPKE